MSIKSGILAGLLGLLGTVACLPAGIAAAEPFGQAFAASSAPISTEASPAAISTEASPSSSSAAATTTSDAPDSVSFANGAKAINESRWVDAIRIFSDIAAQHGEHADGALYWKAYAEDKMGQAKPALDSCAALRSGFPASPWNDDCGALEVEIGVTTGKPVDVQPWQSDEVKLLALNAMMHKDETKALAEIQAILNGDSSEALKKEAQFMLGQHYSDVTYAQIVRISYVEGDVRIQRGEPNAKAGNAAWEKAVADLPVETGFSLVTGAGGRAEIEFENASTVYLGENSVLTFNDLHETAGIPYTEVALLSGTVSLHIHPYVPGEKFVLRTLTQDLISKYPDKTYARVDSYTDAVSLTPLEGGDVRLPGVAKEDLEPGRTWTYHQGQFLADEGEAGDQAFAAWDAWVGDRTTRRDAAIESVMEASGLLLPIPGMAEMAGKGRFFDCAPYGTCWEPTDFAGEDDTARSTPAPIRRGAAQPQLVFASFHPAGSHFLSAQVQTPPQRQVLVREFFPCAPGAVRYQLARDMTAGGSAAIDGTLTQDQGYAWAVCHAGTWIRHRKHYVWVAGCKRHHVDPVRWVKSDRKLAYVPLHPYDVKGQPPINVRHEVFEITHKGTVTVQPVKFEPNRPVEFLKEAPKEFRNAPMLPLARLDAPRMEARAFVPAAPGKGTEIGRTAIPIRFDVKAQSFMMPKTEIHGGKSTTALAPITNRSGSLQARAGSFGGGSGFHGGSSGGSHSGASSSSHGGSPSSSGGSHGSGGSSSASSSGGSSASSGGGSHH